MSVINDKICKLMSMGVELINDIYIKQIKYKYLIEFHYIKI